jgi:putative peptide zinc metalloprotease protein
VRPAAAGQIAEELRREQATLQRLADELQRMDVRAAVPGRLLLDQPADLPGRFVRQGDPLAYVVGEVTPIVRVVVPQGEVDWVRSDTRSVSVRLPQRFGQPLQARLVRAVPGASQQLPSATLGPQGGGPFTVDPRDQQGRTALDAVFEFELELPGQQAERYLGSRAYVAFQHAPEPLGWRWLRALRRQFLSQFEV